MRHSEGRTVGLFTKVSPEEKEMIERKMAELGTDNLRAYLRKMAVDGYIVHVDMSSVAEVVRLLRSISSNVNQIARRCNETRNLYADDVEDLRVVSRVMRKFVCSPVSEVSRQERRRPTSPDASCSCTSCCPTVFRRRVAAWRRPTSAQSYRPGSSLLRASYAGSPD